MLVPVSSVLVMAMAVVNVVGVPGSLRRLMPARAVMPMIVVTGVLLMLLHEERLRPPP